MRPGGARVMVSRPSQESAMITSRRGHFARSPAGDQNPAPRSGRLTFSIDGHHGFRFASPVATGPRPIRGAAKFPNFTRQFRYFWDKL
jgi:hypothetical protein